MPDHRERRRQGHGRPRLSEPIAIAEILKRIAGAAAAGNHAFWPDDVSLTDTAIFNRAQLLGPKQITDRYLLALAVRHGGRLVTFDRAIRPTAVDGASARHLVLIRG